MGNPDQTIRTYAAEHECKPFCNCWLLFLARLEKLPVKTLINLVQRSHWRRWRISCRRSSYGRTHGG